MDKFAYTVSRFQLIAVTVSVIQVGQESVVILNVPFTVKSSTGLVYATKVGGARCVTFLDALV